MALTDFPTNVRLFVAFRILFNARFYYPVFAVMFLDFGLSMEQFALLNVIWAVAIVVLEVPSGALADRIGRARMVKAAAVLMLLEMVFIAFVPLGNTALVFSVFVLNRLLSGAAEASASGADEALAYDSLVAEGREAEWPRVLEFMMRWQAAGFVVAMLVGAAVYDPVFVSRAADWLGFDWEPANIVTMRFPIYLMIGSAVAACVATFRMVEPKLVTHQGPLGGGSQFQQPVSNAASGALALMKITGAWIFRARAVLLLILAGLLHDAFIRMFLTLGSEYYRLIQIPEAWFGVIAAALSGLGFVIPSWARALAINRSARFNFSLLAVLTWIGLAGLGLAWPLAGVMFAVMLRVGMGLLNFFMSHYLNASVDSRHRATVLSFKGLAFNLGYGLMGLIYAGLYRAASVAGPDAASDAEIFEQSLRWLPWCFLAGLVALAWMAKERIGKGRA